MFVHMYMYIRMEDIFRYVWLLPATFKTQLACSFVAPSVRLKFTCKASWRCFLLIESRR